MRTRPLHADDRARWGRLWSGYLRFYAQDLSAAVTDTTWRRLMDPDHDLHGLCALDPEAPPKARRIAPCWASCTTCSIR